MKNILNDQTEIIKKENVKKGSCCSSPGCVSGPISILPGTVRPAIKSTSGDITFADRLDHLMARLGVKREKHL